jgi:hypothetical protein
MLFQECHLVQQTDRSAPTYTQNYVFQVSTKIAVKMAVFLGGITIPCGEVCSDVAKQFGTSTPKHPPDHSVTLDTFLQSVGTRFYCTACKHRENDFHQAKLNSLLALLLTLFIISKVGAILAPIDVESLNALSITDLKNTCNFRICNFSCRKSNYMMAAGNRHLSSDFTSITKEMLNLKYTEDF